VEKWNNSKYFSQCQCWFFCFHYWNVFVIIVGAMAESVIKRCIIEDASLFFRYLFEKLTCPIEQEEMFVKLRKLLAWMPNLPSNAAYTLFNNLVRIIFIFLWL